MNFGYTIVDNQWAGRPIEVQHWDERPCACGQGVRRLVTKTHLLGEDCAYCAWFEHPEQDPPKGML